MNVRTLCLSILHEGEASGYEIRKMCTEGECAYFVEASYGSIYPALAKLEDDGLVTSRIEPQRGKPAKKVYAITSAGTEAFIDALFEPPGEETYRSPFLLFARFAHLVPASLVERRVRERLGQLEDELADLRAIQDDRATHANDAWVLRYGISCLEAARDHLEATMDELIANARPESETASAAE